MVKRKYVKSNYPLVKKGEPITSEWTLRKAKIGNDERYVLVRKFNGKKQRRFLDDKRMSPGIPWGKARSEYRKRPLKARKRDESKTSKVVLKNPNKAWLERPGRSDVKNIDTKKQK